ncbi:MAG: hypothetical protein M3Y22_00130 [Pseudomonadota bacterium]|nr:hypothetical protein [Pseudomonadota bacterium]
MKSLILGIAAGGLLMGSIGFAQTTQGGSSAGAPLTTSPSVPSGTAVGPGSAGANGAAMDGDKSAAAASGNNNQAVATTNANAPTPAKGSNSFTMGEAKSRLEKNGFSNVSDLRKDANGVWRGNAQKSGSPTAVWLDYKGNTGEGK